MTLSHGDSTVNIVLVIIIIMQAFSASYWLELGASADKLNVGLPLYGRSFTLRDPNISGVGAPVSGGGKAGRFTQEQGYLAFYEVSLLTFTAPRYTTRPPAANFPLVFVPWLPQRVGYCGALNKTLRLQ